MHAFSLSMLSRAKTSPLSEILMLYLFFHSPASLSQSPSEVKPHAILLSKMDKITQPLKLKYGKQGKTMQDFSSAMSSRGDGADPQMTEKERPSGETEDSGTDWILWRKKADVERIAREGFGMLEKTDCGDRGSSRRDR